MFVSIKAAAHKWRVTHPTGVLIMNAPRRSGRRQHARHIERDRAHCAMFARACIVPYLAPGTADFAGRVARLFRIADSLLFLPDLVLPLCYQLLIRALDDTLLKCETLGSPADQQDMLALKHLARQRDRIFNALDTGDRSHLQRATV